MRDDIQQKVTEGDNLEHLFQIQGQFGSSQIELVDADRTLIREVGICVFVIVYMEDKTK